MDPGDHRHHDRPDREADHKAGAVDRGAQFRFGHFADHVIVDRNLPKGAEHKAKGDRQSGPIRQRRHQHEKDDLDHRDNREHRAWSMGVQHLANDDLSERGDGENDKGQPADHGRGPGDADQPLLKDFRQGEGRSLENHARNRRGEKDDHGHADQHGAPFSVAGGGWRRRARRRD